MYLSGPWIVSSHLVILLSTNLCPIHLYKVTQSRFSDLIQPHNLRCCCVPTLTDWVFCWHRDRFGSATSYVFPPFFLSILGSRVYSQQSACVLQPAQANIPRLFPKAVYYTIYTVSIIELNSLYRTNYIDLNQQAYIPRPFPMADGRYLSIWVYYTIYTVS